MILYSQSNPSMHTTIPATLAQLREHSLSEGGDGWVAVSGHLWHHETSTIQCFSNWACIPKHHVQEEFQWMLARCCPGGACSECLWWLDCSTGHKHSLAPEDLSAAFPGQALQAAPQSRVQVPGFCLEYLVLRTSSPGHQSFAACQQQTPSLTLQDSRTTLPSLV
jgi:hypothetical protein